MSAVIALEVFQTSLRAWNAEPSREPCLLDVYIILYDILNDDDEGIREKGARIASWTLSSHIHPFPITSPSMSLSPAAARLQVLEFLKLNYTDSSALFEEGLSRLLGIERRKGSIPELLIPAKILLEVSMKDETSLFAEERQNMYTDIVQEVESWAHLIYALDSKAVSGCMALSSFQEWAVDGLATLTAAAEHCVDGPLGWTSNPQVFALGLQVVRSIGVINRHCSIDHVSIIRNLTRILRLGYRISLHWIWMDRVQRVLSEVEEKRNDQQALLSLT